MPGCTQSLPPFTVFPTVYKQAREEPTRKLGRQVLICRAGAYILKVPVRNKNSHLPSFHKTARLRSAMGMTFHEQVLLTPL